MLFKFRVYVNNDLIHLSIFTIFLFFSFSVQAIENKVETLDEVTIIGNTELPRVSFDQPWQLPSVEKTADKSPPKDIPGVLVPIEPHRYREQIHFSQFLDVDVESFKPK